MMFESVDQVIRGADVVLIGFQAKKNVDVVYSRKKLDKKKGPAMLRGPVEDNGFEPMTSTLPV